MQQVTVAQVAMATPDPHPGTRQSYNSPLSKFLGATQIAIGASCIIFQVVAIAIYAGLSFIGHGIWCGVFFIITGTFGVLAGNTKRTGFIVTFMVLSIVAAALFILPLIACAAIGLSLDHYYYYRGRSDPEKEAARAMNGLLIGLALLEGIVAIISSAISCGLLCCPGTTQGTVYTAGQVHIDNTTGQQVLVLPVQQQQYMASGPVQQPYVAAAGPATVQYVTQPRAYIAPPDMQAQGQQYPGNPPPYSPEMQNYTGDQLPETK